MVIKHTASISIQLTLGLSGIAALPATDKLLPCCREDGSFRILVNPQIDKPPQFLLDSHYRIFCNKELLFGGGGGGGGYRPIQLLQRSIILLLLLHFYAFYFHWRRVRWNISVIKYKLASCGQVPNYNKSSIVLIYTVQLSSVEKNVCNCCIL